MDLDRIRKLSGINIVESTSMDFVDDALKMVLVNDAHQVHKLPRSSKKVGDAVVIKYSIPSYIIFIYDIVDFEKKITPVLIQSAESRGMVISDIGVDYEGDGVKLTVAI